MFSKLRAKKEQPLEPPCLITSLPEEVLVDIIARVSRHYYPSLSVVSKLFRSLVASPYLYPCRSSLGFTEACVYVVLSRDNNEYRLYMLRRTGKKNRLALVPSIPPIVPPRSFVPVGSKIYVVGEHYGFKYTSSATAIDCTSHTVHPISRIPNPMAGTVADIIDEKIYVIGYCWFDDNPVNRSKRVMVLDTETQTWEPRMIKPKMELGHGFSGSSVVMDDKMYMVDSKSSFVYEPKKDKWEKADDMLKSKEWNNGCVVDGILYYYDNNESKLRAYHFKERRWEVVKGVGRLVRGTSPRLSHFVVNYGGKLAVFLPKEITFGIREIWCAEIAIEKRKGKIWGKVQRRNVVIDGSVHLMKSLVVVV